jgi:hypothetical protein
MVEPITNYQLPITDRQSPITNYQLPITNRQLPITNHQLPIANHQLPIAAFSGSSITNMPQSPTVKALQTRLTLFIYLIPVFGFFPAWWALYNRKQATPEQRSVSRLAVTLALIWLSGYILLETGARGSDLPNLSLLVTSSLLTTTYFAVNFGLMLRLWKRQPVRLPGISTISDRLP